MSEEVKKYYPLFNSTTTNNNNNDLNKFNVSDADVDVDVDGGENYKKRKIEQKQEHERQREHESKQKQKQKHRDKHKYRIAIIGTAFRDISENRKLNSNLFQKMKEKVHEIITKTWNLNPEDVILISGGAAGADAIAVSLFQNSIISSTTNPGKNAICYTSSSADSQKDFRCYYGIEIYCPAKFDVKTKKFENAKDGRIANNYHQKFVDKTGINSLEELSNIVLRRNNIIKNEETDTINYLMINFSDEEYTGFKVRNTAIARNCDRMIALTFHENREHLESMTMGGTQDTWKKSQIDQK